MSESLVGKSPRALVLECFLLLLFFACLVLILFSGIWHVVNIHWEIPAAPNAVSLGSTLLSLGVK